MEDAWIVRGDVALEVPGNGGVEKEEGSPGGRDVPGILSEDVPFIRSAFSILMSKCLFLMSSCSPLGSLIKRRRTF